MLWGAAGCVAMNSCWSPCCETERYEAQVQLNPRKPFNNTRGHNAETASVPYFEAQLSLLCICAATEHRPNTISAPMLKCSALQVYFSLIIQLFHKQLTLFSVIVCCSHIVSSSIPGFWKGEKKQTTNDENECML